MKDKSINIVHQFLNREIDLDELKKQLSEEDYAYWQSTLNIVDQTPKPSFNAQEEYDLLLNKRQSRHKNPWRFKHAVAIIFLVFSSWIIFYYLNPKTEMITVSYQSDLKENMIYLPDSSKVWLNNGASISYEVSKWQTKRDIQLEGEAFFDVKKGSKFTVNSKLGSVNVLGTTFVVTTQNDIFSVTCYTGKVAVNHASNQFILNAKDSFSSKNSELTKVKVDLPAFLSKWSKFEKIPLSEVIQNIEKMKKVTIDLEVDRNYTFTGGYSNDMPIEDILDLISQSLSIRYIKIDHNHYAIKNSSKP